MQAGVLQNKAPPFVGEHWNVFAFAAEVILILIMITDDAAEVILIRVMITDDAAEVILIMITDDALAGKLQGLADKVQWSADSTEMWVNVSKRPHASGSSS